MTTTTTPAKKTGRALRAELGRLIRMAAVAVVAAALVVAGGSPLWVRHDLHGAAVAAARAGAQVMAGSGDAARARAAAASAAEQHHGHLDGFVLATGTVKVTVARHAPTLLLDRVFTSWYDVRVGATAAPR